MATNFLFASGTNGLIATLLTLLTTELNALANGAAATSSVGGTSGVFTQANTGSAPLGSMLFVSGGAFTPTAGGFLAGWYLRSDGSGNYETIVATPSSTVPALPRPPDFEIPIYEGGNALAVNNIKFALGGEPRLFWQPVKIVLQNMSGVSLPASGNIVKVAPVAEQY